MIPLVKTSLFVILTINFAAAEPASLSLANTFTRLTQDQKLKVVVIGNSVTAGAPAGKNPGGVPSFYVTLENWLRTTFPNAEIEVIPKIIYAIGPEVQLFRMDERVIAEKPDLLITEFGAANGAWGDKGRAITEPATEGFIRRLRTVLPEADFVLVMGIFKTMLDDYRNGKTPDSVTFLRETATHYGGALADAQQEIARRILKGEAWETYMKDFIHPDDEGYQIYGDILVGEFERQWKLFQAQSGNDRVNAHPLPARTLHPQPWVHPKFVPAIEAQIREGFEKREIGKWKPLAAVQPDAHGRYAPPAKAKVVGVLMRDPGNCGNLEVLHDGKWIQLSQKTEPHFTEGEDRSVKLYRNFFGAYGLPLEMDAVEFRISPTPESPDGRNVELVGFFVLDLPFSSQLPSP